MAAALAAGKVRLHGWVYHFESGQVTHFDQTAGQFVALGGQNDDVLIA